jgi:glutaminyl-tRNA synthetase
VKGIIHWLSAKHTVNAEVRLFDRLFKVEAPGGEGFREQMNENSVEVIKNAHVEPLLTQAPPE